MVAKMTASEYVARLEGELARSPNQDHLMRVAMGARLFTLKGMRPEMLLSASELDKEVQAVRGEMDVLGLYATGGFSNWDGLNLDKEGRQSRHGKRGPGAYTPKPSF